MANSFETEMEAPEMDSLASLAENLVYRLPGCSDIMIRKTLQEVYRDFCRRSCCLRGRRQFMLSVGQDTVQVTPMFGGMIESISSATYDRRMLGTPYDYVTKKAGSAVHVTLAPRFVPKDGTREDVLPTVAVSFVEIPKLSSESIPSALVQEYGDSICSGVLFRLMSMTGKAWSDASQATTENVRYENAVGEARVRYYAQNTSGDLGFSVNTSDLL